MPLGNAEPDPVNITLRSTLLYSAPVEGEHFIRTGYFRGQSLTPPDSTDIRVCINFWINQHAL